MACIRWEAIAASGYSQPASAPTPGRNDKQTLFTKEVRNRVLQQPGRFFFVGEDLMILFHPNSVLFGREGKSSKQTQEGKESFSKHENETNRLGLGVSRGRCWGGFQ